MNSISIFKYPSLLILAVTTGNSAITIYDIDFSVDSHGETHSGSGSFTAGSFDGENWTLDWPDVQTDSTTNEFITTGGIIRVQDWGGTGTVTSDPITITDAGTVGISGAAVAIADGPAFNAGSEGLTWFYILNGVTIDSGLLGNGTAVDGTDLGFSFSAIPVSSGDTLVVGFEVDVNGVSDGAEISSLTVDFAPIPEPSAALLGGLGLLTLLLRRR